MYYVSVIEYKWDRNGAAKDVVATTLFNAPNLAQAMRVRFGLGDNSMARKLDCNGGAAYVVRKTPLTGPCSYGETYSNENVELIDLYRETVGEEVFAAQDADENFSINLDVWFMNTFPETK